MATEKQPHFLLIPYSEQGHLNPMLGLASQLLSLRCRVTFVKADRHLPPPSTSEDAAAAGSAVQFEPVVSLKSQPPHAAWNAVLDNAAASTHEEGQQQIRFVTLPVRNKALCVDVKTMTRFQIFKNTLAGLEERQDLIAAIIEESQASAYPITCIICDLFLWKWVRYMARAYPHLGSAVLCILSALSFCNLYLGARGKEEEIEELLVSQLGMPSQKDDTIYCGLSNMNDSPELKLQKKKNIRSLFEGIEEVKTILINSFEALEVPLLPLLQSLGLNVRFIGPSLLECHTKDGNTMINVDQQTGSIFVEDIACLTWLNHQEKGSVLYVAFGSEGEVSAQQVEEIALGIKSSGYKFLWVVRPNASQHSEIMHGLCCEQSNNKSKGIIVSWAPQKRVLQHFAVGGFLTHSGWNSTLESLTFGVPMLCLPLFADHPFLASFVQDFLKAGLRLNVSKDGMVHKEDVASGVQAIMQGCFSHNVSKIKELAQLAIAKAHANLISFVQAME